MIDPESGETYWRVRSKIGSINYTVTEKEAERKHNIHKYGTTAIVITMMVLAFYWYRIKMESAVLFLGPIIIGYFFHDFIKHLSFDYRFIRYSKHLEAEAKRDMAARGGVAEKPFGDGQAETHTEHPAQDDLTYRPGA